jgi:hypothetical protein
MAIMVTHRKTTEQRIATIPQSQVLADADAATAFPHIRVQRATTTVSELESTAATERYAAAAEPAQPEPITRVTVEERLLDPGVPAMYRRGDGLLRVAYDPQQISRDGVRAMVAAYCGSEALVLFEQATPARPEFHFETLPLDPGTPMVLHHVHKTDRVSVAWDPAQIGHFEATLLFAQLALDAGVNISGIELPKPGNASLLISLITALQATSPGLARFSEVVKGRIEDSDDPDATAEAIMNTAATVILHEEAEQRGLLPVVAQFDLAGLPAVLPIEGRDVLLLPPGMDPCDLLVKVREVLAAREAAA